MCADVPLSSVSCLRGVVCKRASCCCRCASVRHAFCCCGVLACVMRFAAAVNSARLRDAQIHNRRGPNVVRLVIARVCQTSRGGYVHAGRRSDELPDVDVLGHCGRRCQSVRAVQQRQELSAPARMRALALTVILQMLIIALRMERRAPWHALTIQPRRERCLRPVRAPHASFQGHARSHLHRRHFPALSSAIIISRYA